MVVNEHGKRTQARRIKKRFLTKCTEVFMVRAFKMLIVTLGVLFLMTGCQAMTGATLGENIDDGTLTSYVKTKLAEDRLVTLTRVGVETNNGIVYLTGEVETAEQRSHIGSLASQVKGVKKVVNNLQVIKR
jgi:virulence-associated protein VapD